MVPRGSANTSPNGQPKRQRTSALPTVENLSTLNSQGRGQAIWALLFICASNLSTLRDRAAVGLLMNNVDPVGGTARRSWPCSRTLHFSFAVRPTKKRSDLVKAPAEGIACCLLWSNGQCGISVRSSFQQYTPFVVTELRVKIERHKIVYSLRLLNQKAVLHGGRSCPVEWCNSSEAVVITGGFSRAVMSPQRAT